MKLRVTHKWNSNYSKTPLIGSTVNTAALDMTKVTDYIGNKVYEQGVLKKILIDGGYIEDGKYYFYQQDHLGNNRMVLTQEGSIVQREYYYPFGMTMPELENDNKHPYRYNGKELDQMHRLDLYDYSARYYDQAIGRFTTVDPLAEEFYSISPYAYCNNNPIRWIDKDGRSYGDPPSFDPSYWVQVAASKKIDNITQGNAGVFQDKALSYTDANDAAVLTTMLTRGSEAINIDGTPATTIDKVGAAGGVLLPLVSGAMVVKGLKWIGKALGIGGDAAKGAKIADTSSNLQKLLTPIDEFDATTTIYRGTTGSEVTSSVLFATDNAEVAATYIKNGGQVVQYQVSQFGLKSLETTGQMRYNTGIHGTTGTVSKEYIFEGSGLVKYMNSIAQPIK